LAAASLAPEWPDASVALIQDLLFMRPLRLRALCRWMEAPNYVAELQAA